MESYTDGDRFSSSPNMIPGTWVLRASTPEQVASATTMNAMSVFSMFQLSLGGGLGFRDLWISALTDTPSARRAPTGGEKAVHLAWQAAHCALGARLRAWPRFQLSLDGGLGVRDLWFSASTDTPSARRDPLLAKDSPSRLASSALHSGSTPASLATLSAVFGRWPGCS